MKKSILALCALTLAAGLSACGGGTSSHTVGGTVTGLEYGPLVLVTNGMEVAIQPERDSSGKLLATTSYTFPKQLDYGEAYNITLKQIGTDATGAPIYQQPPHQECGPLASPSNVTSETAGRLTTINAAFACELAAHTIGGTIEGLTADGLVLTNGSTGGRVTVTKEAAATAYPTSFTFTLPVTYLQTYGVTVFTHPKDQTCTVANGVGTMFDDPIKSIKVTCTNNPVQAS